MLRTQESYLSHSVFSYNEFWHSVYKATVIAFQGHGSLKMDIFHAWNKAE
jgi:hypothetical protein